MIDEITLFLDGIKPVLLLNETEIRKNVKKLNNFKLRKRDLTGGYFVYRDNKDFEKSNLGEILGYPPFCGKAFNECKVFEDQNIEEMTSSFINYNGILFNCFEFKDEAIEWCNKQYKEKMLEKYGKIEIRYCKNKFIKVNNIWKFVEKIEEEFKEVVR